MLLKTPKRWSRRPPESHLTFLILLDAFKEITDVCWFHLFIFAGNQYDGKEGSAGIPKGGRGLKASPK